MRIASNITKRGDVWYFRTRVPKHLVEAFGRTMVSLSLETSDKATAKLRARRRRDELDRALEALEPARALPDAGYASSALHLSDEDIERLCDRFRAHTLLNDEAERRSGMSESARQLDQDIFEAGLPGLRQSYALGDLEHVYSSLQTFLAQIQFRLHRQSPSYLRLAHRFQIVEIEVYDALLQRRNGVSVQAPMNTTDTLTIDGVYKCWFRQRKNRLPKTIRAFEQVFEEFKSRCNSPSARRVSKQDAVAFRDALMTENKVTPQTISKHLGFLRAAFQCASNDGLLDSNPFDGVRVIADEQEMKEKSRIPFSALELQAIFDSEVYKPGFSPRESLGVACYWLPLLSLHQGARLEELAQLGTDSVQHDPDHGWYIRIRTEGTRRVKNASSWRNVPLHPAIVELGFPEFATSQNGRLFPALRPDKYGKLSTVFSTWFGRHLTTLGISDSRKVFHSFRHSFIQVCKTQAKHIPPEVREAIVGHVSANKIAAEYGDDLYPLEPQVAAMQCVVFKGLDLSKIRRA
jgi:integrase